MVKRFFVAQNVPEIYTKNNRLVNSQIHVFASHCISSSSKIDIKRCKQIFSSLSGSGDIQLKRSLNKQLDSCFCKSLYNFINLNKVNLQYQCFSHLRFSFSLVVQKVYINISQLLTVSFFQCFHLKYYFTPKIKQNYAIFDQFSFNFGVTENRNYNQQGNAAL